MYLDVCQLSEHNEIDRTAVYTIFTHTRPTNFSSIVLSLLFQENRNNRVLLGKNVVKSLA